MIITNLKKRRSVLSDWEDVFGAGYTFEQFENDYLRDDWIKKTSLRKNKGDENRRKIVKSRAIAKKNRRQSFDTYKEALQWARENAGRSFRYSERGKKYIETYYFNDFPKKEKP